MITSYFTFGYIHTHTYNGIKLDHDVLIKITAENPRQKMHELFGIKWAFQYDKMPDIAYFPKGIFNINTNEFEQ
jgi:hypothetical protein